MNRVPIEQLLVGWHQAGSRTRLFVGLGGMKVETTRYDLDAALDEAAQYYGEPLERTSPWLTDSGRDPEHEDVGRHTMVTCKVVPGAELHGDVR